MAAFYSVTQVNAYIKNIFSRDAALTRITVRGEVSNCRYLDAGHIYFTLKDDNAAISCVMFQSSRAGLTFRLENGQKIDATGQISVYEKTGSYQLYVRTAALAGTGELYERFLAMKERLQEMGMFDPVYKKPIPTHVKTIGIVTAEGGAAIRDIINISHRRNPYVKLFLMPALVQGQYAPADIADAIRRLDRYHFDVMIVGRGGGSIEDLWAFNEEIVAKAIFDCETPVISAVGHETDFTIADFVADLRAPTPSAAAELANFDYRSFEEQLSLYREQMERLLLFRKGNMRSRLETFRARLEAGSPENRLQNFRTRLSHGQNRLEALMERKLSDTRRNAELIRTRMPVAMERKLERTQGKMKLYAGRLDGCSPLKKLSGGYGYVMSGGKAVRHVKDVRAGDELTSILADGTITSTVTGVKAGGIGNEH